MKAVSQLSHSSRGGPLPLSAPAGAPLAAGASTDADEPPSRFQYLLVMVACLTAVLATGAFALEMSIAKPLKISPTLVDPPH